MGVIYRDNAQVEELYNAYGFSVNGKRAIYDWSAIHGGSEDCIVELEILKGNESIYHEHLGNRAPLMRIFENHINNLLWYLDHEKIADVYRIEGIVHKMLVENDCLLPYKIEQMKHKERIYAENKARSEEIRKREQELKDKLKEETEKRDLFLFNDYGNVHIIRLLSDCRGILEKYNSDSLLGMLPYVKDGRMKELQYIAECKSLESALEYIVNL